MGGLSVQKCEERLGKELHMERWGEIEYSCNLNQAAYLWKFLSKPVHCPDIQCDEFLQNCIHFIHTHTR